MEKESSRCLLCGGLLGDSVDIADWNPVGVTSDAKPWRFMGDLWVCARCGHVQKQRNARWLEAIQAVYGSYDVHSIAGGEEQLCFDNTGEATARARLIAQSLANALDLPVAGRLLDFGCGTGNFLHHFHSIRPEWKLYGQDLCAHFRNRVLKIAGVMGFYEDLESITEMFDLITLNDVLEHLTDPVTVLARLRALLNPGGLLFARSPNFQQNPFDFVILDHCSHFTEGALSVLLGRSGLATIRNDFAFLPKETGFLAKAVPETDFWGEPHLLENNLQACRNAFGWLHRTIQMFEQKRHEKNYVLGCSVAGVWTAAELGTGVCGFVDEDPCRQSQKGAMGLPVHSLDECPAASVVYLPFPCSSAVPIRDRLTQKYASLSFVCPEFGPQ